MSTATGPQTPPPAPEPAPQPAAAPSTGAPAPAAQGGPVGTPARRRGGTWVDLVRSLLVVLAFVALIVLLVPRPGPLPRPQVDLAGAAAAAPAQLGFTPVLPTGLPATWQPVSGGARTGVDSVQAFHISYTIDEGPVYAGLDEARSITDRWIEVNTAGGEPVGDVTIDGVTWQQFFDAEEQYTSLLLRRPDRTFLVTTKNGGTEVATALARSLRLPPS